MSNVEFIYRYLKPLIKAINSKVVNVQYVERVGLGYQLLNISFESGHLISMDITGDTQIEIVERVMQHLQEVHEKQRRIYKCSDTLF